MRVIGGLAKGLTIKAPKSMQTRPTSDKVREAIFSSIGSKVENKKVLDLYAGSGALGLEALSRGAIEATFVESNAKAIQVIKENLDTLGFAENSLSIKKKTEIFLKVYDKEPFDLIFIDAPYRIGLVSLLEIVSLAYNILAPGGLIIVEHAKKITLEEHVKLLKVRKYGQTTVTFIRKD